MIKKFLKILLLVMVGYVFLLSTIVAEDTNDPELIDPDLGKFFPVKAPINLSHRSFGESDLFTGSLRYEYELILPPGTAKMTPELKLVYNSDNQNSWFGMGWELEGLSYIERSNRLGTPNYNNDDIFLLNLNGIYYELVREDKNSSGIGYYRTKSETFMRAHFDGNSWKLFDKDGKVYRFGINTASRIPIVAQSLIRRWVVTDVTDVDGNYISYTYFIDTQNGEYYPDTISYTYNKNSNLSKIKTIKFIRENRTDNVAPHGRWMLYRINSIQVLIDGKVVEKYTFGYRYSKISNRSLLATINRYGSGSICETYTMTYESDSGSLSFGSAKYFTKAKFYPYGKGDLWSKTQITFGDLNGDGLVDYIEREWDDKSFAVKINNGNGSKFEFENRSGSILDKSGQPVAPVTVFFKDVNGDGLDDVYQGSTTYINTYNSNNIFSFREEPIWNTGHFNATGLTKVDGNNDFIMDSMSGTGGNMSSLTQSGWSWTSNYRLPYTGRWIICDLNGDNWPDLYEITSPYRFYLNNKTSGWNETTIWQKPNHGDLTAFCFNDFNGDGLTDIVLHDGVYMNTSYGWKKRSEWEYRTYYYTYDRECVDINNDGLLDILIYAGNGSIDYFQLQLPNGKNDSKVPINKKGVFLCINDDPYPDFLCFDDCTYRLSNAKPDLLSSVTTKNGATISWEYARVPVDYYLSSGLKRGAPFRKYVVTKVTTNEGTGRADSSLTTMFSYPARGKYDYYENTFLGFSWVKKTYPSGETEQVKFYQDIERAGRISSIEQVSQNTKIIKTYDWQVKKLSSSRYQVLLASETVSINGSNPSTSKIEYLYDDYGNVITEKRLGDINSTVDDVTYIRDYINDTSRWLIGFPYREKVINYATYSDKLIWYDECLLGVIEKGHVSEEKYWLDNFRGVQCSNGSFYSSNCSRPIDSPEDPHPLTKYTYDSFGNIISIRTHNIGLEGSSDQILTIQYDSLAHCLPEKIVNAKNQEIRFECDYVTGRPLTIVDPNQGVKRVVYDSLGRITEIYGPKDATNPQFIYDYTNALTRKPQTQFITIKQQIEPGTTRYITTKRYIDGLGRVWKIEKQAPNNKVTIDEVVYDWQGLESKKYLTRFSTETQTAAKVYVYDLWERPLSVNEPDGTVTRYTYDGLQTTITDANQHVTRQYKDAHGRLVKVEQDNDDGTYTTSYNYDALNRIIQILDAKYNPIVNTYDSLGRVIKTSDPYNGEVSYGYDLAGNLITKTDAKGNTLQYEYDELNRMIKKSVIAPGTTEVTVLAKYIYDETTRENGVGQLTSTYIGENTLASQYNYDLEGNITSTTQFINGIPYKTLASYDGLKRFTGLTYPDNCQVNYTYDAAVLKTVANFATYSDWNAAGMPKKVIFNNGTTTTYNYNDKNLRLTNLETIGPNNTVIQSFAYGFDKVGNILSITDSAPISTMHTKSVTQTFTYDKINRLKTSSVFGTYQYDRVGNIIAKEGVSFSYTDYEHPYCPTVGSNGYQASYDANGNLIAKRDQNGVYWRYKYNAENMLIAIYQGNEQGKEYLVEEYFYDTFGKRNQKNTYDGATVRKTQYIYLGDNVLYEVTGSASTRYILAGNHEIAKVTGGKTYFTHRDHLGSSSVVTDNTGIVVNWNAHRPYGENWQISPAGTVDLDKHRFTGKETDSTTGLIYFGARFYDPEVGRFTTVDPAKDGANWYAYCYNNPIGNIDPDGREAITAITLYCLAVMSSPDTANDIQMLAYDISQGDLLGASLDIVSLAAPGVTNLSPAAKAAKQLAENAAKGKAFEKAGIKLLDALLGGGGKITKNTEKIGGRIADVLFKTVDGKIGGIVEFKNYSGTLGKSKQLTTFINQAGKNFNLVIGKDTKVAQTLVDQIKDAGGHIYRMVDDELEKVL